jgi:tetratricopeptide (TPR) repeat protein
MTKCPTCGNGASDLASFCEVCATPLRRTSVATAVLTPPAALSGSEAETVARAGGAAFNPGTASASLAPGQTFGQRYKVISLLGVGGMGAVYHVWDAELGLSLALKVVRPETDPAAAQELERRFKRELVLARQVTHPNVIRIHDLGEIDGTKYITMPFVHGSDLSKLLAAQGRPPLARTLQFARQIVSGLRAAHEAGIVHRDLKPANILIDESDKAIITDFGIARSRDAGTFATAAGAIIGTIQYMAPEQATGRPVDQRADIYAFGLIVFEMLVGRRTASGTDDPLTDLIHRSRQAPPRLRTIDASVPEPIEQIVAKCLEPDPSARYQTIGELEAALDRLDAGGQEKLAPVPKRMPWLALIAAGLLLAATLIGVTMWMSSRSAVAPPPLAARAPLSVLIADFDNQAKDPVFVESLEQALSIAIEGASFVTTYSRAGAKSLLAARKPGEPLSEENARLVAASEGIGAILTGAIAQQADGYRISVRAIDPANGREIATAAAPVADKNGVLRGVEAVAATLRAGLGDTTTEGEARAAAETVTTVSLEALQQYSIAQDLSSSRPEESIQHYRNAIELDKNFGRAYSGLATVLFNTGRRQEAIHWWEQSLKLMELMTERERYRTLGLWFAGPGASYEQAIENFEKLVALYPADRAGQNNLAVSYFQMLDFKKAMDHGRVAVELYPKNPRARMNYAIYATYAGDLRTAENEARAVLKQTPNQYKAYLPLAAVAFAASDYGRMRDEYAAMKSTGPLGASLAAHGLADLAMFEGRWADAEKLLTEGVAADAKTKNTTAQAAKLVMRAELHATSNRMPQAISDLQEALALSKEHSTLLQAALIYVRANRRGEAQTIAQELSKQFQRRGRAYGEIAQGELARVAASYVAAVEALNRSEALSDLWLGRFSLARVYIEAGQFPLAQAELNIADRRRLEASAVFLDDVPSYRYLATLPYWQARVQEGTNPGSAAAAENYRKFLSLRPDAAAADALAADARKRLTR